MILHSLSVSTSNAVLISKNITTCIQVSQHVLYVLSDVLCLHSHITIIYYQEYITEESIQQHYKAGDMSA